MAVCRSYSISPEMNKNVESRRELLRRTAMQVAIAADLQAKASKAV
jgi:hypothetical protein